MRVGLLLCASACVVIAAFALASGEALADDVGVRGPIASASRPAQSKVAPAPETPKPALKAHEPLRAPRDVAAEREALKREIASFGLIAILAATPVDRAKRFAPPAPPASTAAHAPKDEVAMWRPGIDDAFDPAGVRMSGVGDGDGGRVLGVALDHVETIGGGEGIADVDAFDGRRGRVSGTHQAHAWSSRIPPETIQRVVQRSFGHLLRCYEDRLRHSPLLAGRVAVTFTIDRSGAVSTVSDAGSSLPDLGVVECVVRGFASLTFPESRAGRVTVIYPLDFRPRD